MTTLDAKFAAMVAKYNGLTAAQVIDYLATAVEQDAALDSIQAADDHMQDMAIALRALALPPQPVEVTEEQIKAHLREHWLSHIICDHEAKTDTAVCSCSQWRDEPHPSVGAAVDAWIEHVFATRPSGDGIQAGRAEGGKNG